MISFCIPAYTYVTYSIDCIQSLLLQNEDFEIVVVEDFDMVTRDNDQYKSVQEARDLLSSDNRIRWIRNKRPLPVVDNWNYVVSLANRPYIKLLGADDRIPIDGVKQLQSMIVSEPKAQFHGHLAAVIGADGQLLRKQIPFHRGTGPLKIAGSQSLKLKLRQVARFKEPVCNLFTKQIWSTVGGYSDRWRFCWDIAFNVEVMSSSACCLWNTYAGELRRHAASNGAKLPAELALNELADLIKIINTKLGASLTEEDRHAGQGWLMYRMVELAVARYSKQPIQLLRFLANHRAYLSASPMALKTVVATAVRRASNGDVQLTLDG